MFIDAEEQSTKTYILEVAESQVGITLKDLRKIAFYYLHSVQPNEVLENWTRNGGASTDWYKGFMTSHCDLSRRIPENTSFYQSEALNAKTVNEYVAKMFRETDVQYDESGVHTVLKSPNVIAKKGNKQVGAVSSAEGGP